MPLTTALPARYEDVRLVARGGMADVFVARDQELNRLVAIKVLSDRFSGDRQARHRFRREALAAARLSGHPHVVTIFDVGECEGRPYIVMEYLSGGTLANRARGEAVAPARALDWLEQAASPLDAAHAEGIVHRDVKPANLLFDSRDALHVADFGIARVLDTSSGMTVTGTILGTAGYISPEQARGEPAAPASDIYALGVVAYELLTGTRPFARRSATAEAAAHANDPVPSASKQKPELPAGVDAVFERALAKDPVRRFDTAGDLVDELRAELAAVDEPTRILPATATVPAGRPPPSRAAARRRVPWPLVLLGLLLLGGGIAAAVALTGGGDSNTREVVRTRTVTEEGTTVKQRQTVTVTTSAEATPPPPPPPEPPPPPPPTVTSRGAIDGENGGVLNDRGYRLMQQGRYDEAEPVLAEAVQKLRGSGSDTEAFALYNYGYTILQLGDCSGALPYFEQSEAIQGHRVEIDQARRRARKCAREGDD